MHTVSQNRTPRRALSQLVVGWIELGLCSLCTGLVDHAGVHVMPNAERGLCR